MPAAVAHKRLVIVVSFVLLAAIFVAFTVVGSPLLGIGHFFYVPITLAALVTSPRIGAAVGILAACLYALGILINPSVDPSQVLTVGTAIRLATYTSMGAVVGWFAADNRRLLAELQVLAERDSLTGLPNTRAFEAAIHRRLERGRPFALLIGNMLPLASGEDPASNDRLLALTDMLGRSLGSEDELARIGDDEFAVLTPVASAADARRVASRLQGALNAGGTKTVFGWATYPQDGRDALSLYRGADERLYARKLLGERERPAPVRSVS